MTATSFWKSEPTRGGMVDLRWRTRGVGCLRFGFFVGMQKLDYRGEGVIYKVREGERN